MKLKILFIVLMLSTISWGQAFSGTYPFTSVTTTSGLTDPTAPADFFSRLLHVLKN